MHGTGWYRFGVAAAVLVAAALALVPTSAAEAQAAGLGDVPPDAFYAESVAELHAQGALAGTLCDDGFCPSAPIDRKTMAVWVVRLLDGTDPPPISRSSFDDVDADSFYAPFVERMADWAVTTGCGDGTVFCPDSSVTRAQMAVFLTRAYDLADGPDPGFTDVGADAWYAPAVARLAASGITTGCGDGTVFCPDSITTRAQMAVFLRRAETTRPPVPDTGDVAGRHTAAGTGWLAALEGTLTVPVFTCGPAGQYTADDVRQATAQLNSRLDGFFHRLTSGRIDLVFSEGAPIHIDQDFEPARAGTQEAQDLRFSILRDCGLGVDDASDVRINFVIIEFNPCGISRGCAYYGGNSYVHSDLAFPFDNSGLEVAVHELVHSVLRLPHLKNYSSGSVLIDEGNITRYGPESYWTSLTRPPLACYQYERLGWPAPEGYSEPCARLSPSGPLLWSTDTTDDGGEIIIRWAPPLFVDAPVTGYTIQTCDSGGSCQRQELPANARTATLRFPDPANSAGSLLDLWANSSEAHYPNRYNPVESESETAGSRGDLAIDLLGVDWVPPLGTRPMLHRLVINQCGDPTNSSSFLIRPRPPRVGEVSVDDITSNSVGLTWDAEELIRYETEHAGQFHYQIERIASDLPDEDPNTICPPVPWRQGQWTEQLARSLSQVLGCNPTNRVRADTTYYPNGVFTYGTAETITGGRAVEAGMIGLDPSTQYTFRVRTCNDFSSLSCSPWSTATASTSGAATLPPPSGIRIASGNDEVSGDWALVTWDPVPGAEAYEIEVVNEDVTFAIGRRLGHSYDLSGDLPDSDSREIVFRIRSCKTWLYSCGDGEWTTVSVSRPASRSTPPPYRVSVKEVSDAYTRLDYWIPRWRNAHSYTLEYQYTDGTSDSGLQDQDRWYRYLVLPTDPNKNYTVKIRNCEGPSAEGNSCSTWTSFAFSTYPATSSIPPPSLRVVDIPDDGHGVTRILWDGVPGALSYDWELEIAPGNIPGGSKLAGQVSSYINSFPIPEYSALPITEPGREYTIRIRSCGVPTEPCGDWATTKFSTKP